MYNSETVFSLKRKEIVTEARPWMNLEDLRLSEISQAQMNKLHDSS